MALTTINANRLVNPLLGLPAVMVRKGTPSILIVAVLVKAVAAPPPSTTAVIRNDCPAIAVTTIETPVEELPEFADETETAFRAIFAV